MLPAADAHNGENAGAGGWNATQRAAISAESERILAHPVFKSSKRCVTLFRYLIKYALAGNLDGVKERTLGIEVFDRSANYDTNSDPVVRMAANEIRKRLAQYYQESTSHHALSIRLIPGTYMPSFDFDATDQPAINGEGETPEAVPVASPLVSPAELPLEPVQEALHSRVWLKWMLWVATVLLALGALLAFERAAFFRSPLETIWTPILESNEPVLICVADVNLDDASGTDWAVKMAAIIDKREPKASTLPNSDTPELPFVDADTAARMSFWLGAHHHPFSMKRQSVLTLEDLRRGPVVLIGAFDNPWTLALLSGLRYRFRVDPANPELWIEDTQNPSRRDWKVSGKPLFLDSTVDYAIVTRFLDADTGKWILAAGGLGKHATEAAAEWLTDPAFAKTLPPILRTSGKNFQIVLTTTVIDGHTGPPKIVALYTW